MPRSSLQYARIVDPLAASSSRTSRRGQNYPARNAKFTGAAHKSTVIPSAQCEGRTGWARAHIVGAYCARGRQYIYDPLSHATRAVDPAKRGQKKKPRGRPGVTSLAPASSMTRQKRSLSHLYHVQTKCRSHVIIIDTRV